MPASMSRQLAKFVHELSFNDLPPKVVDKAKAVTLHALATGLVGYTLPEAQHSIQLIKKEESVARGGSTILVDGAKVTKAGSAFVNGELIHMSGQSDTYRMYTHPGLTIFPGALAAVEEAGASGKEFITAIVAGYEVQERLTGDFVPSVVARGFHSGPLFGIFGAAVAAGKLMGLDEDQMNSAIALCVSLAGGNLEAPRGGGQLIREPASARKAILAVLLARDGAKGGETALEGDAGFFHSFVGNNKGKLSYVFRGRKSTNLDNITAELGSRWEILDTIHKMYATGGFNMPHVDVTAKLCADNNIRPQDVEKVELVVNWLETNIAPAFPSNAPSGPRIGSSHYFAAYGIVKRGYPVVGRRIGRSTGGESDDPPEVLELMKKVTVIPSKTQTLFGPRITIYTKNGKSYSVQSTGREFMWDLKEEIRRSQEFVPGMPIPKSQFEEIVAAVSGLDKLSKADKLIQLTLKK